MNVVDLGRVSTNDLMAEVGRRSNGVAAIIVLKPEFCQPDTSTRTFLFAEPGHLLALLGSLDMFHHRVREQTHDAVMGSQSQIDLGGSNAMPG